MKKVIILAITALMAGSSAIAQHCGNCPHHRQQQQCAAPAQPQKNADGIDLVVVKAFPKVKSVKADGKWIEVLDAQKNLLGYVVYSKPASDAIKGYAGETPVMIAFDVKKKITGVYLLANQETPGYVKRVQDAGFFDSWNGLTVKKALKKKVDTVSGATFTSRAVAQSVQAALSTL